MCPDSTMWLPKAYKCDGMWDCANGEDEQNCYLKCPNSNMRLPASAWCDGLWDCALGEDEENC